MHLMGAKAGKRWSQEFSTPRVHRILVKKVWHRRTSREGWHIGYFYIIQKRFASSSGSSSRVKEASLVRGRSD